MLRAAFVIAAASATVVFPLYRQCDPRWGSVEMGVAGQGERATICQEGCAMTSLSMALAGYGVVVAGTVPTPLSVNTWLEQNNGYTCADGDCNNLVLTAPERVSALLTLIGELPPPPLADIAAGLANQTVIYLAHVRNASHFVLVTGVQSSRLLVNDPFYNSSYYDYASVSDMIMYSVALPPLPGSFVVPKAYPLFKQCDAQWGQHLIVSTTICAVGCLMSSTSMAIAGHNIRINATALADPGTLNSWLQTHEGYTSGNDLIEDQVPLIAPDLIAWSDSYSMHVTNDLSLAQIQALLVSQQPVIANVLGGRHFVLVTGWNALNPDELLVNDPGFSTLTYSYSTGVVGWRLFNMTQNATQAF